MRLEVFVDEKPVVAATARMRFEIPPQPGDLLFPAALGTVVMDLYGRTLSIHHVEHGPSFLHENARPESHVVVRVVSDALPAARDLVSLTSDGWTVSDFSKVTRGSEWDRWM